LENGAFAVGLGSSLVDKQLAAARAWAALTDRARELTRAAA
jgi:2-keto-3-deoxy-6-phosphogluconate aldolase